MGEGADQGAAQDSTAAICALLLALEALGSLVMWAGIPLAWLWIGSLGLDLGIAFLGFVLTLFLVLSGLRRVDQGWIALRRRAGYEQKEGALSQVVTVSATLALVIFMAWYYLFSHAYVIPFMPSNSVPSLSEPVLLSANGIAGSGCFRHWRRCSMGALKPHGNAGFSGSGTRLAIPSDGSGGMPLPNLCCKVGQSGLAWQIRVGQ